MEARISRSVQGSGVRTGRRAAPSHLAQEEGGGAGSACNPTSPRNLWHKPSDIRFCQVIPSLSSVQLSRYGIQNAMLACTTLHIPLRWWTVAASRWRCQRAIGFRAVLAHGVGICYSTPGVLHGCIVWLEGTSGMRF